MWLDDAGRAACAAIVAAEAAWVPRSRLEARGHGPALLALEADGWVARWEVDDWHAVTLTPLGAERLGVRIVEFLDQCPTWARPELEPPTLKMPPEWPGWTCGIAFPERIPDPRGPDRDPEQAVDGVTGEPMTLFGGHPVWLDARLRGGRRAG